MKAIRLALLGFTVLVAVVAVALFTDSGSVAPFATESGAVSGADAPAVEGPPKAARPAPDGEPAPSAPLVRQQVEFTTEGDVADLPPPALLTARIRVLVEEEAGRPVAGAAVLLAAGIAGARAVPVPFRDYTVEETTGPDGVALFKVPPISVFTVTATCEGYAARTLSPVLPADAVTVRLSPGHRLRARLRCGESGLPVADALVRVEREGFETATTSGPEGEFAFADLTAETYRVEILAAGYDVATLSGVLVGPDAGDLDDIVLSPGIELRGVVKDRTTGAPVGGALVEAGAERRVEGERRTVLGETVTTGPDGRFRFAAVSRAGISIAARSDGYATARERLALDAEQTEHLVEIELLRGSTVAGTVVGPDGVPVAGARVHLVGLSRDAVDESRTESDDRGRFRFTAVEPQSRFGLVAVAAGHAPATVENLIVEEGDSIDELVVPLLPGGTLRGRVVNLLGAPVEFAQVTIADLPNRTWRSLELSPLQYTDGDGCFEVSGLPESLVNVSARIGEFFTPATEVAIVPGGIHELTLELQQGLMLAGVVVDPRDVPIEGALVSAFAVADEFSMPSLPEGLKKRMNAARSAGRGGGGGDSRDPGGERSKDPQKRDQKAAKREQKQVEKDLARFTDRVNPERLFRVATGGKGGALTAFRALDRTDPQGQFALVGLSEGERVVLAVSCDGYEDKQRFDAEPGGEGLRVVLAPLVSLTGSVVDERTRYPLQAFQVTASPVADAPRGPNLPALLARRKGSSRSFRSTDGVFVLTDLRPGRYEVSVRANGYRRSKPVLVRIDESVPGNLLIALTPGSIVRGRVVAFDGSAVVGVPVFMKAATGQQSAFPERPRGNRKGKGKGKEPPAKARRERVDWRSSNGKGEFAFKDIAPGPYLIGAGSPASPVAGPFSVLVEDGAQVEQNFQVDALGGVTVEVHEESGFRLGKALVELRGKNSRATYRKITDDFGSAVFENVLADEYQVTVRCRGFKKASETLKIDHNDRLSESIPLDPKS